MRIGIDLETNLAHNKIWVAKTIDLDTGEIRTWKQASELSDWLKDCTLLTAHNGIGFDFKVLKRLWSTKITMKTYDTLVVSRLLEPSRENGHSLESWGETLGTRKTSYSKIWQWMMGRREEYPNECFDNPIMPLLEYYCEGDVKVLRALFLHLESERERLGFSEMSVELEHQVAYIIAEQEDNGFKLNIPYALNLLSEVKTKLADLEEWFQERWPPVVYERYSEKRPGKRLQDGVQTFNPGSRKQIGDKLKELGWKPEKFTETGQPQVDETTLEGLPWEEAKKLAQYFLLQKRIGQIESWVEAVKEDGRVHGRVITNGAVTGRMTHMSPNMAQVPNAGSLYGPECRECWTVEKGSVLVGADASGLELRMLAHYMKDERYTKAIVSGSSKDGTDIHTVNQKAAGLDTRDQAKTFIYAFLYGAGPAKIGSIVGGTAKEGKSLTDKFLRQTPALGKLKKRLEPYITKGYVPGLDGRKIWIRSEHAALNSLLQGAGAIVMKKALVLFYEHCRVNAYRMKLVANVHDELQCECHPEDAESVGKAARQAIIDAGLYYNLRCPLDGEFKIGLSWRETH